MARDWDRFVREVMERVDLSEFLGQYTTLKRRGSSCMGLCPLHGDKDPSFSVSSDVGLWHCFGCKKGGNIFTFIMEKEGMSFVEAAELVSNRYNIPLPTGEKREDVSPRKAIYEMHEIAEKFYSDFIRSEKGEPFREYLRSRKITKGIVEKFNIGAASNEWDSLLRILRKKGFKDDLAVTSGLAIRNEKGGIYDRFRNRLMIPIRDHLNRIVGFGGRIIGEGEPKYMNSPESPVFKKGEVLFGLTLAKESIRKNKFSIIMEGYTDVMRAHQCGFTNAVASMGTALTESQIKKLSKLADQIYLAFDGDTAGIKAAVRSCEELLKFEIITRVVTFEEGMDPEDFLRIRGRDEFAGRLDKSKEGIRFLIDNSLPAEMPEHQDERIDYLKKTLEYMKFIKYGSAIDSEIRRVAGWLGISESLAADIYEKNFKKQRLEIGDEKKVKSASSEESKAKEFELMKYIVNFPAIRLCAKEHLKPSEMEYYPYKKFLELIFDREFPIEEERLQSLAEINSNPEFLSMVSEFVNSIDEDHEYSIKEFNMLLVKKKCDSIKRMRAKNRNEMEKTIANGDNERCAELQKINKELGELMEYYRKDFLKEDE